MPMHTWMTQLYNHILPGMGAPGALGIDTAFGNRFLHQITIPGTHDAGCYISRYTPASPFSQTQELTIAAQLMHGIRYFDLRPRYYWSRTRWVDEWWIHHGGVAYTGGRINNGTQAGEEGILQEIAEFLHNRHNDQELVILNFSHFYNFDPQRHLSFVELIEDFLWDFLLPHTQVGTNIQATSYHQLLTGLTPARPVGRARPASLPAVPVGGYGAGPRSRVLIIYDGALDDDPIPGLTGPGLNLPNRLGFWVLDPKYPAAAPVGGGYPLGNEMRLFDQYANSADLEVMRSDQLNKLGNRTGRVFTYQAWSPPIRWNNNPPGGVPGTLHLLSWTLTPQRSGGFPVNAARNTTNPALEPLLTQSHVGTSRWPLNIVRPYDPQLDPMINIIYVDVSDSLQYTAAGQPWTNFDMPVALAMYLNHYIAAAPWDNWGNW
jgi:hypothetical protein